MHTSPKMGATLATTEKRPRSTHRASFDFAQDEDEFVCHQRLPHPERSRRSHHADANAPRSVHALARKWGPSGGEVRWPWAPLSRGRRRKKRLEKITR